MIETIAPESVPDACTEQNVHEGSRLRAEWGQPQRLVAEDGLRNFNEVLGQSAYVAGKQFWMAYITLFAGLGFADFALIRIPADQRNLQVWRERMNARPSVVALGG